jgi:hypothetical protein
LAFAGTLGFGHRPMPSKNVMAQLPNLLLRLRLLLPHQRK